jgi:hypothetical protein
VRGARCLKLSQGIHKQQQQHLQQQRRRRRRQQQQQEQQEEQRNGTRVDVVCELRTEMQLRQLAGRSPMMGPIGDDEQTQLIIN